MTIWSLSRNCYKSHHANYFTESPFRRLRTSPQILGAQYGKVRFQAWAKNKKGNVEKVHQWSIGVSSLRSNTAANWSTWRGLALTSLTLNPSQRCWWTLSKHLWVHNSGVQLFFLSLCFRATRESPELAQEKSIASGWRGCLHWRWLGFVEVKRHKWRFLVLWLGFELAVFCTFS